MSEASAQESLDSADGWARASELFLELADLESAARRERLDAIDDPELLEAVTALLGEDPGKEAAPAPRRFGPYVEVQRIGAGGMGEVFLSRRADGTFERDVAVKLLRPGLESAETNERFLRERQTLAALEHESIVRLLDGGTTEDDRPFLVMEYVDGLPIDDFCRENELDLRARLRLFCRVLEGVAHAHARGVIHRDLKPSNILVRHDGAPRIVDFGIARLADDSKQRSLTRTGARMFTPEFASPEQIAGEPVNAATDVFSLGVVLYRLITGHSPWPEDTSTHKIERAVLHAAPPPPSRVSSAKDQRAIRGDLDTIVLHCIDPVPERRYPDAQMLADELERFLGGYTIRARPIGHLRRATRWIGRKPWHATAIVATLIAGLAVGWIAIERERDAARRTALRKSLPDRFAAIDKLGKSGLVDSAQESVAALEEDVQELLPDPEVDLKVRMLRAQLALHANDVATALEQVRLAREIVETSDVDDPIASADLAEIHANALGASGDFEGAARVASEALEANAAVLANEYAPRIELVTTVARSWMHMNRAPEAVELLEGELDAARAGATEHDPNLAEVLGLLGRGYDATGRSADAIPLLEESLETQRWHHGTGHDDVAEMLTFLGKAQLAVGRSADAVSTLSTAREAYSKLDHPQSQVFAVDLLAQGANAQKDYELALECLRENQDTIDSKLPESKPMWFITEYQIAFVYRAMGRLEDSRNSFETALSGGDEGVRKLGRGAEVQVRLEYSKLLDQLGESDAARQELEDSLELWEAEYGPEHPMSKSLRARLAQ